MTNLVARIEQECAGWNGIAVSDAERAFSYPELFRDVHALADALKSMGVVACARVAVLADDSYECIVASLALLSMSAAVIPLSTRAQLPECEQIIRDCEVNFLLADARLADREGMRVSAPESFRIELRLVALDKTLRPLRFSDDVAAFVRFSSGTTGVHKGVILSHSSILARTDACVGLRIARGDRALWTLDMAFHFVVTILLFLRRGAEISICPQPMESHLEEALRRTRPALLYATPYHYRLFCNSETLNPEDFSCVKQAVSTAMRMEPDLADAFRRRFRLPVSQAYGIIEVGLPCVNDGRDAAKAASVGRLQPAYRLRIDEPDAEGRGRVMISGPGFFDAYLNPYRTRAEACPDGWFDTGDVGRADADGFLFLLGRAKSVINFCGMKIFPQEVESVLLEFPGVREARVRPVPSAAFGELPIAEIVGAFDPTELRRHCYARLAPYKVPKSFLSVERLPKTASGKTKR